MNNVPPKHTKIGFFFFRFLLPVALPVALLVTFRISSFQLISSASAEPTRRTACTPPVLPPSGSPGVTNYYNNAFKSQNIIVSVYNILRAANSHCIAATTERRNGTRKRNKKNGSLNIIMIMSRVDENAREGGGDRGPAAC